MGRHAFVNKYTPIRPEGLKWFEFNQNNSGGSHDIDAAVGTFVLVEAANGEAANEKAESIGIYFDGCRDGRDCGCCGDRWYSQYSDDDGDEVPSIYGAPIADDFEVTDTYDAKRALSREFSSFNGYVVLYPFGSAPQYGYRITKDRF